MAGNIGNPMFSNPLDTENLTQSIEVDLSLDKQYAHGGQSDIYKCFLKRDTLPESLRALFNNPRTEVVLKVLRGFTTSVNTSSQSRIDAVSRRLRREAAVWRTLNHENILPFYGVYQSSSSSVVNGLIMPLCINNLEDYARDKLEAQKVALLKGAGEGVRYLHENRLVHGDIKPHNILVNARGVAVLSDFGTTRVLTIKGFTTAIQASKIYTAPEILLDDSDDTNKKTPIVSDGQETPHKYSYESDVYSFGITVLEILSGKKPFRKYKKESSFIIALTKKEQPEREDGIKDTLWRVLTDCWAFEPSLRPGMKRVLSVGLVPLLA